MPDARAGLLVAAGQGSLLSPLGRHLRRGRRRARMQAPGTRAGVPVICLGNLTVGGAGKTPAALAVAHLLLAAHERPFFLSRGYGGRLAGPVRVNPALHRAADVGDEPLLLARLAPTIVARDRVAGAQVARFGRRQRDRDGRRISKSVARQGSRDPAGRRPPRHRQRPHHSGRPVAGAARTFSSLARRRSSSSARRTAPPPSSTPPRRRGIAIFHAPPRTRPRRRRRARPPQGAGLRRHRRSGKILCDARRGRHRRRRTRRAFPTIIAIRAAEAQDLIARAEAAQPDAGHHREGSGAARRRAAACRARRRASTLPVRLVVEEAEQFRQMILQAVKRQRDVRFPRVAVRVPLQHRLGRGIGLLQVDAPIAQLLERNRHAGHRAAHERTRPHDAEIAVEIFDIGLAGHRVRTIGAIEQLRLRLRRDQVTDRR